MKPLWICIVALSSLWVAARAEVYTLKDQQVEVVIDEKGNLVSLKNPQTKHDYAGGRPLWRLYFDRKDGQKENEVVAPENQPAIQQQNNRIVLRYDSLKAHGANLRMKLVLSIRLEDGLIRFSSEVSNDEPHTIIRELHYPLVGGCRLPADCKLLTTQRGGQLIANPTAHILSVGNSPPYMAPSQFYRQMDLKYPGHTSANCFALVGGAQGLYLASHDPTLQDTWHGLRVYPDAAGAWTALEAGLYKYPNCVKGQSWSCDANVIAPYSGSWHQTSKLYRKWADTWWRQREVPLWVRKMKGWQRLIFVHQYGEQFFSFADLSNRIRKAGQSVGCENVLAFGWWKAGMDNGYPDSYWATDAAQGGDKAWAQAIADFRKQGGRLMLYFNGKLIDTASAFYRNGDGKNVCYHDNTGAHYTEQYRFKGLGTFTGHYNARTFVVADTRRDEWRKQLLRMADRAISFGVDSVFYDQLGYAEANSNWDLSGEFPIPNTRVIADKADTLKMIHDYLDAKASPDFALGTEHCTDVTAQHVDYIHNITGATGPTDFTEWIRFTFPEVILSDREIRDDTDIPRRVNHALLKGLRNDIEIYRCRDLIDKAPNYQRYLAQVNRLKEKYCDLLLLGRYKDTEGFANDNPKVNARCFINGDRMAVVATQTSPKLATACIRVPGYSFKESSCLGEAKLEAAPDGGQSVRLGQHGLAILVYEKTNSAPAVTDQQLCAKADDAWRAAWERFYDDRTHLFYDYVCSYDPAKRLAALPTPKEARSQHPNPNGWGTGMEDCAISGGLMLSMICDRFAATNDAALRPLASKVFAGLASLVTVSATEGFVSRGICPSDRRSHYPESSRDQYTWHVYGLWRYYHSPLSQPAEKAAMRKIIAAICRRLERNIVAAKNYSIGKDTGSFDGIVDKMWENLAHEIARLPMIYAIGADLTGDNHWKELARRYSPEAAAKSKVESTKIPYALLQEQVSLDALYQLEDSPELKWQWLEAMQLVADRAQVFLTKCLKYQPPSGAPFWFDWRTWPLHKSSIYKVPTRPDALINEGRTIREPAEAALVQLLCPQRSLTPEQLALMKRMIAQVDYDKVVLYGHYYTQAVYWRAVRLGLLKLPAAAERTGATPKQTAVIVNQAADAIVNYLFQSAEKDGKPLGKGATKEMALAALRQEVDQYEGTGVSHVFWNVNYQRVAYRSDVWPSYWDVPDPEKNITDWPRSYYELHKLGIDDVFAVVIPRCRERGVSPWISLRMNDHHYTSDFSRVSPLFFEHPELRTRGGKGLFNYAKPEVREHYLKLATEVLQRYDVDGLELDWIRSTPVFNDDEIGRGREILTDFMRTVRRQTQAAAKRLGHPVQLAVRVPVKPEFARGLAMDAIAWAREGLVDMIIPSDYWNGFADLPVEEWRAQLGPDAKRCRIVPFTATTYACTRKGFMMSRNLAALRGFAASMLDRGVDGIYFFNNFQQVDSTVRLRTPAGESVIDCRVADLLRAASDLPGATANARVHAVSIYETLPPKSSYRQTLPAEIAQQKPLTLKLHTGPKPTTGRYIIRVGLDKSDDLASAKLAVRLNGTACRAIGDLPVPAKPDPRLELPRMNVCEVAPRLAQFEAPLDAVMRGYNSVELAVEHGGPQSVIWLEILIDSAATNR